MAKKTLVLFFALALTAVAAFFSFQNLGKMKDERIQIASLERQIDNELQAIENGRTQLANTREELNQARQTSGERIAERDSLTGAIERITREIASLDEQIAEQQAEIDNYEAVIAELQEFFRDMEVDNLEQLNDMIEELAQDRVAREREVAEVEAAIEAANSDISRLEGQIVTARRGLAERAQRVQVNTREPLIVAVNNEWGFVIINAGTREGFTAENTLLAKRGDRFIAKLSVTSITDNQIVADLVPDTLVRGAALQPGDRVILEEPNP